MSRKGREAAPEFVSMAEIAGAALQPFRDTRPLPQGGARRFTDTKELENSALRAIAGKQVGTKNSRHTGKFSRIQQKNQR
ncbi:hypothetical protein D3C75_1088090 [compost metagenome]